MPPISIIKKSDMDQAKRFDAEYFKPEYLEIEKKLTSLDSIPLKNLLGNNNIFSGPFGSTLKSENYQDFGIPFIRISNIQDIFIQKNNLVYISENESKRLETTTLDIDDIVLSKIGTIGKLSLITEELGKVNISENNMGLRLEKLNLNQKRYILFFLLSKHGQSQIFRTGSGNIQLKFNVKDVENILIPSIFTNKLDKYSNIYNEMIYKQNKAKESYKQAERVLLEELDLLDFEIKHQLTFTTTKKEVEKAGRFDAQYFQPKYEEIIKKIEDYKGGFCEVGKIVNWEKGFEVGSSEYLKEGFDFGRVSDFSINGFEKSSKKISEKRFLELKKDFQPHKGEILFTKDGTIGIAYLLKEEFEGILSSAFLRVKVKNNFDKECLTLILNSILSKLQIEKLSGGAIINHLKPSEFEQIKIPLISQLVQEKISNLVKESHLLRKEAKGLLEQAKRRVEDEIEKEYQKRKS